MSALAHDIKTPLTIIRGNAELLSETELTTEQKKNITYNGDRFRIYESSNNCRDLVARKRLPSG